MLKKYLFTVFLIVAFSAATANAIPIVSTVGNEGLGSFVGDFEYSFSSDSEALIVVSLTNTSPVSNGGYLTAFAFNNPGNLITGVNLLSSDPDFGVITNSSIIDGVSADPYGDFDLGSSTSGSWLGGGNPNNGITVGDMETFTFILSGSNLGSLTNDDFFSTLALDNGEWFVARFRGFLNEGSDKVPATSPINPVPEPATLFLLGTGLLGLAGASRKKFSR